MARKFSTGLRQAMLNLKPVVGPSTGIALVNATKTITHSGNGLAVFRPGDIIIVSGAGQATNNRYFTVATVMVSTGASLTVVETPTEETAASSITITLANARSLKQLLNFGTCDFYTGTQPLSADLIETGTKLLRITKDGAAFVAGTATNGIEWEEPAEGTGDDAGYTVMRTKEADTYKGIGIEDGSNTPGWFRYSDNAVVVGPSTTAIRFDGSIGGTGAQLVALSTLNIIHDISSTLQKLQINIKV